MSERITNKNPPATVAGAELLTNKVIDGTQNTLTNIPASAMPAVLIDTPRRILFGTTWPARPNDNRPADFLGGSSTADAPTDPQLRPYDMWIMANGVTWLWDGTKWVSGTSTVTGGGGGGSGGTPLGAPVFLQEYFHDAGTAATNQTLDLGFNASSFKGVLTSSESAYLANNHAFFAYFCLPHNLISRAIGANAVTADQDLINNYPQAADANYVATMQGLANSYGIENMYLFMCPEADNDPGNTGWAVRRFFEAGVGGARPDIPTGLTRLTAFNQLNHFILANNHGGNIDHHQLGQILGQTYQARGYKVMSNNVNAATCHFFYEMGMDLITLQRLNDDISGTVGGIAFIRGAGRQYQKPWGIDTSGYRSYGLPGPPAFNSSQVLTAGFSPATFKRHFYLSCMSGANVMFSEADDYVTNGATTINGRTYNPLGATVQGFSNFAITRHPQRGVPHVPIAIMKDHISMWEPLFGQFAQNRAVWWQQFTANGGENMLYNLWATIYPGYNNWATSTTAAEPWGAGLWGEQFDVITERVTATPLAQYDAVIVSMDTPMDATLQGKLQTFVQGGGIVVLNAKQLTGTAHETLTGVHLTGTASQAGTSNIIWDADLSTTSESAYNYSTFTPVTSTVVAHSGAAVQVTKNIVGAGQVWVVMPDYMSNAANTASLNMAVKLIGALITNSNVASISGGNHAFIDYAINTNAGSSGLATTVTIINTHASNTTWTGTVSIAGTGSPVREWVLDTTPSSSVSGGNTNISASVPGGDVRVYAVG